MWIFFAGYVDPPAGVNIRQGLYYNPYFPGGAIGMPAPLNDGAVEYEDGTPATASQMAKDVSVFLAWCAEPEHDDRKRMGTQFIGALVMAAVLMGYLKRFKWAAIKSRRVDWRWMQREEVNIHTNTFCAQDNSQTNTPPQI